jgi:Arc/MetJ-type ribon-helix-helix transcriptional regulator
MTTISVPITPFMEAFIEKHIQQGYATNKADVVRKAISLLAEQRAIDDILKAEKEPTLKGDLKELAKQLRTK